MADLLGISGPEEWLGGEFCGFSFCLIYRTAEALEAGNLQTLMGAVKKISQGGLYPQSHP